MPSVGAAVYRFLWDLEQGSFQNMTLSSPVVVEPLGHARGVVLVAGENHLVCDSVAAAQIGCPSARGPPLGPA